MAKAIRSLASGRIVGNCLLGRHGDGRGSPIQQVHDGDTIIVEADGNLSVRFLGIDTPEVSYKLPGTNLFRSIGSDDWAQFLNDPFLNAPQAFLDGLGAGLRQHLQNATGQGCAANHSNHAEQAHRHLEQLVQQDMQVLGLDRNSFRFFLSFSHEVMDGYGRFLCFINRDQPNPNLPEPRPHSYNERLLEAGMASPYFIWPNINPFRQEFSIVRAVPPAGNINQIANGQNGLGPVRTWVRNARANHDGIFENNDPLMLQPFELRFLSGRTPPHRWVIDLSQPNTTTLLQPTEYYTIANIEDRLFIPDQYVPLFVESGWQRQ